MSDSKKKLSRHEQRVAVFQLLFETPFRGDESPADIFLAESAERDFGDYAYIKDSYLKAEEKLGELDSLIAEYAVGWKIERLSNTARALLRLAIYELLYSDVPPKVVINEAVEIAKEYATEDEASFANGILNRLARDKGVLADGEGAKT